MIVFGEPFFCQAGIHMGLDVFVVLPNTVLN